MSDMAAWTELERAARDGVAFAVFGLYLRNGVPGAQAGHVAEGLSLSVVEAARTAYADPGSAPGDAIPAVLREHVDDLKRKGAKIEDGFDAVLIVTVGKALQTVGSMAEAAARATEAQAARGAAATAVVGGGRLSREAAGAEAARHRHVVARGDGYR